MTRINAKTKSRSYPIIIGAGALNRIGSAITTTSSINNIHVIYDAQLYALHGRRVRNALRRAGTQASEFVIPPGERSKAQRTVERLCDYLLSERISRNDLIVAVGGGVTTDIAGYTASIVLRGVRWGAVPTSLLGMVDAAIGGKTGINNRLGKNLIGTFWQPSFVLIDPEFLYTLERREMVAGFGEIIKYAGLIGGKMLSTVERYLNRDDLYSLKDLGPLIVEAARYKAKIITQDEREAGVRVWLNLGHTFGHGIESSLGYGRLRHGEAVILGILAALELSEAVLGRKTDGASATYRHLVECGVRLVPKRKLDATDIYQAMALDKKRDGADLKYVLLDRIGKPRLGGPFPKRAVIQAISRMLEFYEAHGGKDANRSGRKRPQP